MHTHNWSSLPSLCCTVQPAHPQSVLWGFVSLQSLSPARYFYFFTSPTSTPSLLLLCKAILGLVLRFLSSC